MPVHQDFYQKETVYITIRKFAFYIRKIPQEIAILRLNLLLLM